MSIHDFNFALNRVTDDEAKKLVMEVAQNGSTKVKPGRFFEFVFSQFFFVIALSPILYDASIESLQSM